MYTAKNFSHLIGTTGFSEALLKNHFTLYEGYVTNVNKLSELLKTAEVGTPLYTESKRRFGWEWDGMRLHEFYFGNMKNGGDTSLSPELKSAIEKEWGSFEAWEKDFKGTGGMRGIGWAILAYDKESERLFNVWIGEHDMGHLAGAQPLLVMDVFEHAFMLDYGTKRADYISAFWNAIDWSVVSGRYSGK